MPRERIRVAGAHVYDVRAGSFSDGLDVVIEDGRIAALAPPAAEFGGRTIHARGAFLLPGLIDAHVHLAMRGEDANPSAVAARSDEEVAGFIGEACERTVMAGVTTVRDLGGWNHVEMAIRDDVEAGRRVGPRMVLAGRLLSVPTPAVDYYPGMYEVCRGPDEVRVAVRRQAERGAGVIKVMATGAILSPEGEDARASQFSFDELRAAVEEAAAAGLPVAAHAHAVEGIRPAVEAGVASIEHGTFADDAVLHTMAERGTYIVATLGALQDDAAIPDALPEHIRRRFDDVRGTHREAMRAARRAGVPFAMGTDAGAPGDLHGANASECVRLVRLAGLSPEGAIAATTLNAAELLSVDAGTIEPGRWADLIAVRSDPLKDIEELTRVAFVMKGGAIVRDQLEDAKA